MKNTASEDLLTVAIEPLSTGAAIVRLIGEIDISSAHLLSTQFAELSRQGNTDVILDATKVTFMDSTGLHALVEGKRILHETGTRLFLVPSTQVRRVLELVFPEPLFAARLDSVDEAMSALAGETPTG